MPRRRTSVVAGLSVVVALATLAIGAFVLFNARSQLEDSRKELAQLRGRVDATRGELETAEAESAALADDLERLQENNQSLTRKVRRASDTAGGNAVAAEASPEDVVLAFQEASRSGDMEAALALGEEGPIREWFGTSEFNEAPFRGCEGSGELVGCVFGDNSCIDLEKRSEGYWIRGVYGCDTP